MAPRVLKEPKVPKDHSGHRVKRDLRGPLVRKVQPDQLACVARVVLQEPLAVLELLVQ